MLAWLANQQTAHVDTALLERLQDAFPGATEHSVRAVLQGSGLELAPMVEGVRQDTFAHLRRTLTALAAEYEGADRAVRQRVRRMVIDQSAPSARRPPREMTLTWRLASKWDPHPLWRKNRCLGRRD